MSRNAFHIDRELLISLLWASRSTALLHKGQQDELHALGAAEATANLIYLMVNGENDEDLESMCQHLAAEAIERSAELVGALDSSADDELERVDQPNSGDDVVWLENVSMG